MAPIGSLKLRDERVYWRGDRVELTVREVAIVELLVSEPGRDVSYRRLYDVVRGKGFRAGCGSEGFRANVRSFIKRIRKKFRDVDPGFDQIKLYHGFGYRWSDDTDRGARYVFLREVG